MSNRYELELESGKKVVLKEFKIKTKNLAAKNVFAKGITGQEAEAAVQDEILKLLLDSVDGKQPSGVEREDLDQMLSFQEYQQIMMAVQDLLGAGLKKPNVKVLTDSGAE